MSVPKSDLKVYIFSNDYNAIRNEVYNQRHSVTGGNLFGLMTTSGSAVVHVVLGPGQSCSRKKDSFKQEEAYVGRIEQFLEESHMLWRIGEWYSQSLPISSNKSSRTIQCNFPIGMSKFLVIKANINDQSEFKMTPYFFTRDEGRCVGVQCVVLDAVSPFSKDLQILAEIKQGAERKEFHRIDQRASPADIRGNTSSSGASSTSRTNPTSRQNSNNPSGETVTSESEETPTKDLILKQIHDDLKKYFGVEEVDMELTGKEVVIMIFEHNSYHWMIRFPKTFPRKKAKLYRAFWRDDLSTCSPCKDYLEKPLDNHVNILLSVKNNCQLSCSNCGHISKDTFTFPNTDATSSGLTCANDRGGATLTENSRSTGPHVSAGSHNFEANKNKPTPMEISHTESPRSGPASLTNLASPASGLQNNNPRGGSSSDESQNSEGKKMRPIVLKEIQDDLQLFFRNEGQVETKYGSDGEIQMTFKHHNKDWTLHFPKTFPNGQPAKLSRALWSGGLSASTTYLENCLENRVNIFLSIKKNCSPYCNICKNFTKENLTKPATEPFTGNPKHADTIIALENEIHMSLATPLTFAGKAQDDGGYRMEFKHYLNNWLIVLPTKFPDVPAEVYKQESSRSDPKKQTIRDSGRRPREDKSLISSELIMKAIRSNCCCSQCHKIY